MTPFFLPLRPLSFDWLPLVHRMLKQQVGGASALTPTDHHINEPLSVAQWLSVYCTLKPVLVAHIYSI